MPELPEVETIKVRLNKVLPGSTISDVSVSKEKSFHGNTTAILNKTVNKVSRRAKIIRIHLDGAHDLLVHLKMTGQLIYHSDDGLRLGGGHPTADWVSQLPSKHTRVFFKLIKEDQTEAQLFFNDMRIFGWIKSLTKEEILAEFSKYAPDINSNKVTPEYFFSKLQSTARKIKQVVLDNAVIAGVGNIYACDGLHLARVHPERIANSLSRDESDILLASLKEVIAQGIDLGGATIDNYRNVDGFSGGYQSVVRVYGKEGQACVQCPGIIQKKKIGGRGTYFCEGCQH